MGNFLTLHIVFDEPYSNLNRDDSGTPKRVMQGGALRALLSSQSIKRGIRMKYEETSHDLSVRSGKLTDEVIRLALQINPDADEKALKKAAAKRVGELTKASDKATEGESDRSAWLSTEELMAAAHAIVASTDDEAAKEFILEGKTGSLSIAAFGRMFANAPTKNTEAALAVSPGVTTHAATIESDYFSTTDDIKIRNRESGATFLSVSRYITGTFYRTVTIDKNQLRDSWTSFNHDGADDLLRIFLRACVYGLPRGKENSTAPYTLPALIVAEEQQYRTAYDFEQPVGTGKDGGYLGTTIAELSRQYSSARAFDPANFGPLALISGTAELADTHFEGVRRANLSEMIDAIVEWIRQ